MSDLPSTETLLQTLKPLQLIGTIKRFLTCKLGTATVEYAVVVALILVVCIGAVQSVGNALDSAFDNISTSISSSDSSSHTPPPRGKRDPKR